MSAGLFIPIRVDALFCPQGEVVLGTLADFRAMPWRDGTGREHNASEPFLSQALSPEPFDDQNLWLEPGLHLHWTLPDAMTVGRHPFVDGVPDRAQPFEFMAAPNRWLVSRSGGSDERGEPLPDRQWIVESDHLRSHGEHVRAVLWPLRVPESDGAPFAHLGRAREWLPGELWQEGPPGSDLASRDGEPPLTSQGWGEPTFAALYSNCYGIFGFHDEELAHAARSGLKNLRYSVVGWYSQQRLDPLARFLADGFSRYPVSVLKQDLGLPDGPTTSTGLSSDQRVAAFHATFQDHFGWSLPADAITDVTEDRQIHSPQGPLSHLILGAEWSFAAQGRANERFAQIEDLVVASTGTEAISAWVAAHLSEQPEERRRIENQLEALTLTQDLAQHRLDLGPRLSEARHTRTFRAASGGTLWTLREEMHEPSQPLGADAPSAEPAPPALLEDVQELDRALGLGLSQGLHALNQAQAAWDRGQRVLLDLRRGVYSDWCRYMLATYRPPELSRDHDAISPDAVTDLVRMQLVWLDVVQRFVGHIDADTGAAVPVQLEAEAHSDFSIRRLGTFLHDRFVARGGRHLPGAAPSEDRFLEWCREFLASGTPWIPDWVFDAIARDVLPKTSDLAGPPKKDSQVQFASVADALQRTSGFLANMVSTVQVLTDALHKESPSAEDLGKALENVAARSFAATTVAHRLRDRLTTASRQAAEEIFRSLRSGILHRRVHHSAAPRFWEPNEPVVLLVGDGAIPSPRYGSDGLLPVRPAELDLRAEVPGATGEARSSLMERIERELDAVATAAERYRRWARSPDSPEDAVAAVREFVEDRNKGISTPEQRLDPGTTTFEEIADDLVTWADLRARALASTRNRDDANPNAPLFLEWEVRHWPTQGSGQGRGHGNVDASSRCYHREFLALNFRLEPTGSELEPREEPAAIIGGTSRYVGRSVVTAHARQRVLSAIDDYLDWYESRSGDSPRQAGEAELLQTLQAARTLLEDGERFQSQVLTGFNADLLMHRQTMQLPVADPLAFPDDGDPTTGYAAFTHRVANAVGDQNRVVPHPQSEFQPIRSGELQLEALRLVDHFGRMRQLLKRQDARSPGQAPANLITPMSSHAFRPERTHHIGLAPRITQPARIDFRWLAAYDAKIESHAHPHSNPICGWLIPNNLDASIMVYGPEGDALGYVDVGGRWRQPPGRLGPITPSDIHNAHLARVVQWIVDQARATAEEHPEAFVLDLIDVFDRALENIAPSDFGTHEGMALLMGRPIAVARARVLLELSELPATHQGEEPLRRRVEGHAAAQDRWTEVAVPVRIGEHMQFHDGVVGYWVEDANGEFSTRFCLTKERYQALRSEGLPDEIATKIEHLIGFSSFGFARFRRLIQSHLGIEAEVEYGPQIVEAAKRGRGLFAPQSPWRSSDPSARDLVLVDEAGEHLDFHVALADDPHTVTVLLDPRCVVHCTTGVLPTKRISVPSEHYKSALQSIGITFLSSPLVTQRDRVELALPHLDGMRWSWIDRDGVRWRKIDARTQVRRAVLSHAFPEGIGPLKSASELWSALHEQGWLREHPERPEYAFLATKAKRRALTFEGQELGPEQGEIERVLEMSEEALLPPREEAHFEARQELREGWLELSYLEDTSHQGQPRPIETRPAVDVLFAPPVAHFEIVPNPSGAFMTTLTTEVGQTLLQGESTLSLNAALELVESIRQSAGLAECFHVGLDEHSRFRFTLQDRNRNRLAQSAPHATLIELERALESVRLLAGGAGVRH